MKTNSSLRVGVRVSSVCWDGEHRGGSIYAKQKWDVIPGIDVIQDAEAACRWLGEGARARPASRARCGEAQLGYSH